MLNIRSYKKMIKEANVGDTFYFDATSGTISMIEYTKELIKVGKIMPDKCELDKMIKSEYQYMFYNGDKIASQMTYRIIK